ncbi:hypothetical protein, partial [Paenibacillus graminis]|uniref:hypothetical protein n=1 Tax=Paenibacillus graminis TaxID=189425 RepID=UPI002DB744CF
SISAVVEEQIRHVSFNNVTFAVVSEQTRHVSFNNGTFAVVEEQIRRGASTTALLPLLIYTVPHEQCSRLGFQSSVTWRTTPHKSYGNSKWKKGH